MLRRYSVNLSTSWVSRVKFAAKTVTGVSIALFSAFLTSGLVMMVTCAAQSHC